MLYDYLTFLKVHSVLKLAQKEYSRKGISLNILAFNSKKDLEEMIGDDDITALLTKSFNLLKAHVTVHNDKGQHLVIFLMRDCGSCTVHTVPPQEKHDSQKEWKYVLKEFFETIDLLYSPKTKTL